ncbi:MAG: hypothetical protein J7K66_02870 [Anaerolineaceae bacterium]|nr:hypothetical protein [Anaerolineaceae bacterium]
MEKILKKLIIGTAFIAMLLVSACGTGEVQEPAPDIGAIKTEAVQTAMAEMTVQAALSPSETPLPPTPTLLPTVTQDVNGSQPTSEPNHSVPSSVNSGGSSNGSSDTVNPTKTPVYKCEYISQHPLDQPEMAGSIHDVFWSIRNVGTVTWTVENFYVKWIDGDDISPKHIYKLPHDVLPYATVDIGVDIYVPNNPVEYPGYITNWAIVNDKGKVFCRFYYHITHTFPGPTATP